MWRLCNIISPQGFLVFQIIYLSFFFWGGGGVTGEVVWMWPIFSMQNQVLSLSLLLSLSLSLSLTLSPVYPYEMTNEQSLLIPPHYTSMDCDTTDRIRLYPFPITACIHKNLGCLAVTHQQGRDKQSMPSIYCLSLPPPFLCCVKRVRPFRQEQIW